MTDEICRLSIQQEGNALKYVKSEFRNDEICRLAIQQNINAIHYVPQEFTKDR